jgi:Domain of unknown function (DUF4326)/SNF2-related domain
MQPAYAYPPQPYWPAQGGAPTRVVNCRYERYDVYIGRPGPFGNPWVLGRDGTRDQVIAWYEAWVRTQPALLDQIRGLRGLILGCHCKPQPCHGDVIARIADEQAYPSPPQPHWGPPQPAGPPRPPAWEGVLHGELTDDGQTIVLIAQGIDWGLREIGKRLSKLTALLKSPEDEHGRKIKGPMLAPATWATVVQLGFSFNSLAGYAWVPGPRLSEWIATEAARRLAPPPPLPGDLYPPWLKPYDFQLDNARMIAAAARFILMDEAGLGKAQPVTTPVWTPAGWTELGYLTPGDLVYNRYGQPVPVRAVHYQGEQEVWRVTFSDRTFTLASGNHLWRVWTRNDRYPGRSGYQHGRVLTTDQLREHGLRSTDGAAQYYLPQQPVITGQREDLPLDPYAYGALLGDGSLGVVSQGHPVLSISCPDDHILVRVQAAALDLGTTSRWNAPANRCQNLRFHRNGKLLAVLSELGACVHSSDKFVHPRYLHATEYLRRELLAGLLDTDGGVADGCIEFSSASPQLASDVAWLARSLGAVVTQSAPQSTGYIREDGIKVQCLLRHRLAIRFPADGPNPFRVPRKADTWATMAARLQRRHPPRTFKSIESAGSAQVCCIELDTDDPYARVYLTDTSLIPTHNTVSTLLGVEARRLAGAEVFPMVIVVPSWEVGQSWKEHIATWAPKWGTPRMHGGDKRVKVITARNRHEYEHDVFITTFATARRDALPGDKGPLCTLRAASVVVDECHMATNQHARQTSAVQRIARHATTIVAASGTLVTRDARDPYTILEMLDPASFPSGERYTERYCRTSAGDYAETVDGLNPLAEPELRAVLSGQMHRYAKADVLPQLPPKIFSVRRPVIPPEWRHAYDEMEQQWLAELPGGDIEMSAMDTLTRLTRLSQLASSAADVRIEYVFDERIGQDVPRQIVTLRAPSWKAESLTGILAERPDQPTAAFTESRPLAMITGQYCEKAGLRIGYIIGKSPGPEDDMYGPGYRITDKTRQSARDGFQAGKLDVIICTAGAGGTGITLTAANCAVMLQRSWQYNLGVQVDDRIHRIGAEIHDHVEIIDVVAQDTVDERRREILKEKAGHAAEWAQDPRLLKELLGGIK